MINYALLANAMSYYSTPTFSKCGFKRVEAPWSVSAKAISITAPSWATWYPHQNNNYLVASGEQSFIQLMLEDRLPPGKYCCLTPCYRGEEKEDTLHKFYFMKVELINTENPTEDAVQEMIAAAQWFITHSCKIPCKVVETEPADWDIVNVGKTYDIVDERYEIELGSYGIREHEKVGRWAYGTGLAEPRASTVAHIIQFPGEEGRCTSS